MRATFALVLSLLCFFELSFHAASGEMKISKDESGNTVITFPRSICFRSEGVEEGDENERASGLETVVNALADCSKQGKGYDRVAKKCTSSPAVQSSIVANPSKHGDRPYRVSLLYCHWDRSKFSSCSPSGHAYGGVANFQTSAARASGTTLTIAFQSAYATQPMCSVTFENLAAFALVNTEANNMAISLRDTNGNGKNWSSTNTWMYVICHGHM
ncbi:uncharacterized protein LOC134191444 [Corticium candelabrum]|uniref:uncharacterized protein LOC134191444 n=1 Tax=Corticium candelabrum TaxID=121492 RepID=UPI002E26C83A|nr:uncharacterized protein LOC134191444 [Corticium candelabrum]